jgi:aminopeptidase N
VTANLEGAKLKLTQERMLISGKPTGVTWPIPLVVKANGQTNGMLMDDPAGEIGVNDLTSLTINPDRRGFYATNNQKLEDIIWRSELSAYDRWGLIFDSFLFLLSGRINFEEYLAALKKFEHEDVALPAQELSNQLQLIYTLAPSKMIETSKRLHHTLLQTFKNKSDERSSILRGTLASRLAFIDPAYAATLASSFKEYGKVDPNMRLAVAVAYARSTNNLENIVEEYRKSSSDEDKIKLLSSMTVFSDERLVERSLNFIFSGEVKRQDIIAAAFSAVENPDARTMFWGWLKSKFEKLLELYRGTGLLGLYFGNIIPILCVGRVTEAENFFAEHMIPDAETGIKVGLEKLHAYDRLAKEITRHA